MKYTQILTEEECKGKTIDRIEYVHSWYFFLFTDNTFCCFNVNFCTEKVNIKRTFGNEIAVKLGFMTKKQHEKEEKADKERKIKERTEWELKQLKELAAKYPEALKTIQ